MKTTYNKITSAIALFPIRLYRRFISPRRPPVCRYTPTCSEYAIEAIQRYGAAKGMKLAIKRLSRCCPGKGRGHDPVP